MKVAIVCKLVSPGGVQSCCFSLIRGLNRKDTVPYILWDIEPNWELLKDVGVQARYQYIRFPIPTSAIEKLPDTFRYLAEIANAINGDRIKSDYDFFFIFYNGFLISNDTPHLRYLSGPPLLPQLVNISPKVRGIPFRIFRWFYEHFLYKIRPVYEFHTGSNYVINSQYTAALFKEAHSVELPVIHPPITISGRNFNFDDIHQRDTLLFFSRIVNYKRPEMVLYLANRYRQMRCVVMGGVSPREQDYFKSLLDLSERMELKDTVFLANPSNQRILEELSRTRFFVFPTVNEHFGMVTVEAIASGAVPYVHDSGGQKEIVPEPRLRFQDPEFIRKFDDLFYLSESELNNIRKNLNSHIQQFSEEVFIDKMLSFIKE